LQAAAVFADAVFGCDVLAEGAYDFAALVQDEIAPASPICLASVPGYDASYRVNSLVAATNAKCTSIALGSSEGIGLADRAIASAARTGSWVCLQNVHLDVAYLSTLEKRLSILGASAGFRLFLTSAEVRAPQYTR
jgi:dynein heavy chain 1